MIHTKPASKYCSGLFTMKTNLLKQNHTRLYIKHTKNIYIQTKIDNKSDGFFRNQTDYDKIDKLKTKEIQQQQQQIFKYLINYVYIK